MQASSHHRRESSFCQTWKEILNGSQVTIAGFAYFKLVAPSCHFPILALLL
ncbi:MAG: hypothetical protein JSR76_01875 [Verrucomicrobia bacterium]|nr:hypothetical protein [Verrucomicrobiota bacterium]